MELKFLNRPKHRSPEWQKQVDAEVASRPGVVPLNERYRPTPEALDEVRKLAQRHPEKHMPVSVKLKATGESVRLEWEKARVELYMGRATLHIVIPENPFGNQSPHLAGVERR